MKKPCYRTLKEAYLADADVHTSLKKAILLFADKDPVDAYWDCRVLLDLMKLRADETVHP